MKYNRSAIKTLSIRVNKSTFNESKPVSKIEHKTKEKQVFSVHIKKFSVRLHE